MSNNDLTISAIDAFEVTIPIQAPLRHSYGVHEAFTRTIVTMTTTGGLIGISETAASSVDILGQASVILGLNVHELGLIRMRVANRFYWSNNPLIVAALEMACIDIVGKAAGEPAHRILGGALRPSIDMAAYCFYRYPTDTSAAVSTPGQMVAYTRELVDRFGYGTIKLKGGVQAPEIEMATMAALREEFPDAHLRFDPNAAWTPSTAMRMAGRLEKIGLQYYEDPAPGLAGMQQVRSRTTLPLATNMVVVDFPDLAPAVATGAVDVVLSDPWYWGGAKRTQLLGEMCHTFGLSMGMHSGIEFGLGMAAMAHTGVTIPNLTLAVDAHYHHLVDDIIKGPRLLPDGHGKVTPPDGPGWGVELDPDKVGEYRDLHASGKYANLYVEGTSGNGADPYRPGWYPVMPAW